VPGPDYSPPGRHIRSQARLWPSGPVYRRLSPAGLVSFLGWAGIAASRLGRSGSFPAGPELPLPGAGRIPSSASLPPGVGRRPFTPRVGRRAPPARPGSFPPVGPPPLSTWLGRQPAHPSWAGARIPAGASRPASRRANISSARLGRIRRIPPGRDSPSGRHLHGITARPGRDSPGPGRITPW
jgi:hypothetical protein